MPMKERMEVGGCWSADQCDQMFRVKSWKKRTKVSEFVDILGQFYWVVEFASVVQKFTQFEPKW